MLKKAEHVGIMVSDMDRSIRFYTEVLGLSLRERVWLNEATELAFLPVGDTEIELVYKKSGFAHVSDGTVNHLAFTVEDIEAVLAHLRSHGVELIHQEPLSLPAIGARIAFFYGPDRERLELFQR